jgi:hypothetical protein
MYCTCLRHTIIKFCFTVASGKFFFLRTAICRTWSHSNLQQTFLSNKKASRISKSETYHQNMSSSKIVYWNMRRWQSAFYPNLSCPPYLRCLIFRCSCVVSTDTVSTDIISSRISMNINDMLVSFNACFSSCTVHVKKSYGSFTSTACLSKLYDYFNY